MPVSFQVGSAAEPHITFPKTAIFVFPTATPKRIHRQQCHRASLSDDVNVVSRKDSTNMCRSAYKRRTQRNRSRRQKRDFPPFPFTTREEFAQCFRALYKASAIAITRINRKHISRPPLHTHRGEGALPRKFVQQADGSERECRNGATIQEQRETEARGNGKRGCREAVAHYRPGARL